MSARVEMDGATARKFYRLERAALKVLAGLNARIEQADPRAVPVFDGLAEMAAALNALSTEVEP